MKYEIEQKFGEFRVCKVGSKFYLKSFRTMAEAEKYMARMERKDGGK